MRGKGERLVFPDGRPVMKRGGIGLELVWPGTLYTGKRPDDIILIHISGKRMTFTEKMNGTVA